MEICHIPCSLPEVVRDVFDAVALVSNGRHTFLLYCLHFTLFVYLDLQKAFDTVNHDILLHKLYNYGVCGVVHDWFRNYLTNRQQFICVAGIQSSVSCVSCGAPQGSVPGPLLLWTPAQRSLSKVHVIFCECFFFMFFMAALCSGPG